MNYFIIKADILHLIDSVTRETGYKPRYWNSRLSHWTEEKFLAKRYTSRGRAETVANKLSTKRAKNITVEEVIPVRN
jgi:hypothetical protein